MFLSAKEFGSGTRLQTPVCIVGGGVAGITIARELDRAAVDCVLLESGGLDPDVETQSLYRGKNIGREYFDLAQARLRYFGGTSNHWAGNCRMLQPIDFQQRDWVPHSGWPFTRQTLLSHYERAQSVLQLESSSADPADWQTDQFKPLRLPDKLRTGVGQFSTTRFGQVYRDELKGSERVRVVLYANALQLDARENGASIASVTASTLSGQRVVVEAERFIIAMGGIENARFLLLSNHVHQRGVGNDHDLVGRYFMEHLGANLGRFVSSSPDLARFDFYETQDRRLAAGAAAAQPTTRIKAYITPSPETYSKYRMNTGHIVMSRVWSLPVLEEPGYVALKQLVRGRSTLKSLGTVLDNLQDTARAVAFRVRPHDVPLYTIHCQMEQSPNPSSRVTLGDEKDGLGQRRVQLNWQLQDQDLYSVRQMIRILAVAFGHAQLGRVRIEVPQELEQLNEHIGAHWHHMGTTRMHDDPKQGVVDRNCKVHGVENLYVAGSSVFPTSGFSVPTFTIVALSIRLADHIKGEMQ
ncbi:MAG: GMC family oxidoreductase [Planctomycetes bacterium]|nr:GMC family oxidoreductase [Planctomycetota bacterium]